MRANVGVFAVLLPLALSACASLGGLEGGDSDGGRDAPSARGDGSRPDVVVAKHDAGTIKHEAGATDAMRRDGKGATDAAARDAGHDAGTSSDASDAAGDACGVTTTKSDSSHHYVASGGTAITECTLASPCGTLADALAASAPGDTIYVGPGTFTSVSPLILEEGMTIAGGWTVTPGGNPWALSCSPTAIPTIAASAQEIIFIGSPSASTTSITLANLKLANTLTVAPASQSIYGIFAVGTAGVSSLVLDNVSVTLASTVAGAGAAGIQGVQGVAGASGGCLPGGTGLPGLVGDPGPAGLFGPTGYTPAAAGAGPAGAAGGSGIVPPEKQTCTPMPEPTTCLSTGLMCETGDDEIVCSGATESGCGGMGGHGGATGGAGGSSVALYLWNENAVIEGGSYVSGAGGAGGAGGPGGLGGVGAAGLMASPSGDAKWVSGCSGIGGMNCTITYTTVDPPDGAQGGPGGVGGQGGGGAGGDSYAYYAGAGAAVITMGAPVFTPGAPGAGGTPAGTPGTKGNHN